MSQQNLERVFCNFTLAWECRSFHTSPGVFVCSSPPWADPLMQPSSVLAPGTPCPACFRCFPLPTHLIQMNGSLSSSGEENNPFIWGAGSEKDLEHVGQGGGRHQRTRTEKICSSLPPRGACPEEEEAVCQALPSRTHPDRCVWPCDHLQGQTHTGWLHLYRVSRAGP